MPRALVSPLRFGIGALILGAAITPSAPTAAQVLLYEGPYGYERPYGPPPRGYVPAPPRGYGMLPPGEVRAIVVGMGYRQVSRPRLAGRTYVVTAVDEDGPAVLRLDAFTGRVVSARSVYGGPTIAVPTPPGPGPRRTPPPAPPRAHAPAQPPVAVAPSLPAKPLPPSRSPEPAVATVTPAPTAPQAVPAPDAAKAGVPQPPASQSAAPQAEPANPGATPANPEAGRSAAQSVSAAPQRRKAGAGTATTDTATAGSASVLSRPKAQ